MSMYMDVCIYMCTTILCACVCICNGMFELLLKREWLSGQRQPLSLLAFLVDWHWPASHSACTSSGQKQWKKGQHGTNYIHIDYSPFIGGFTLMNSKIIACYHNLKHKEKLYIKNVSAYIKVGVWVWFACTICKYFYTQNA